MEWLKQVLADELAYHGTIAAVIVIVFSLLSRAMRALLRWAAHKVFARTETVLDDRIVSVLLSHVRPLMVLTGLHIAVREIRKAVAPGDETLVQLLEYGEALLYIAVVILAVKILLGILREIIDWYLERAAADGSSNLKATLSPITSKVANILVGLVAVIIILDHFSVNIGSLLVSLGVGSLAVALAAQDTLANMIAGFVILVDRPFRVGDRVEIPSGQIGDVVAIGLRSTKMVNFDNNLIIIPNAELVKSRITNLAQPVEPMRLMVKVGVAYGSDPGRVRSILLDLAAAHPDVLPDPAPEVHCTALNDSAVEFTLVARASDFRKRWGAENDIREQACTRLPQEGIRIPFPQRVVHLRGSA
jgi:small-conductance mechanosensitive channel